jgi:hypothetical protein
MRAETDATTLATIETLRAADFTTRVENLAIQARKKGKLALADLCSEALSGGAFAEWQIARWYFVLGEPV